MGAVAILGQFGALVEIICVIEFIASIDIRRYCSEIVD